MKRTPSEPLVLPWPPSANHVWRHVFLGGRHCTLLSREGRRFRQAAMLAAIAWRAGRAPLDGKLAVRVAAVAPDRRKRDLDNLLKATLDALTHAKVWHDDGQIDRLEVERAGPDKGRPRLEITIRAAGTGEGRGERDR